MTVKSEAFVRLRLRDEIVDLEEQLQRDHNLLEKGFAQEGLGEFRLCINRDPMYAPTWEGAAAAYDRLGNHKDAAECQQRLAEIVRSLWDRRIEAEIGSQHPLWRKGFGRR